MIVSHLFLIAIVQIAFKKKGIMEITSNENFIYESVDNKSLS